MILAEMTLRIRKGFALPANLPYDNRHDFSAFTSKQ